MYIRSCRISIIDNIIFRALYRDPGASLKDFRRSQSIIMAFRFCASLLSSSAGLGGLKWRNIGYLSIHLSTYLT